MPKATKSQLLAKEIRDNVVGIANLSNGSGHPLKSAYAAIKDAQLQKFRDEQMRIAVKSWTRERVWEDKHDSDDSMARYSFNKITQKDYLIHHDECKCGRCNSMFSRNKSADTIFGECTDVGRCI